MLAHLPANLGRAIEPLTNKVLGTPARRARRVLATEVKVVGLVAVFVPVEPVAAERLAGQRRRVDEGLPPVGRDGALGEVEAVGELDARQRLVRLEKGRPQVDGGWVVVGALRVVGAVDLRLERGIIKGIVLGVAADADVGLAAEDVANVG